MGQNYSTFTFTPSVKQAQERYGSRRTYQGEEDEPDRFELTEREVPFIAARDGFYMATVGENGWPYMQFRGGPKGFLKVLDARTLAFADFRGNRQYISTGNLDHNGKAMLFLMDYPNQRRLKIWATTKVLDPRNEPSLASRLVDPAYPAKVERLFVFTVEAYDWNCPQHITPRYTLEEVAQLSPQPDAF